MSLKAGPKVSQKLRVPKLRDANNVTKKNSDCYLILTEGDSAASFFECMSKHYMHGNFHDNFGVFPLKGVTKNISDCKSPFDAENVEIKNLIEIIGF